MKSSRTVSRRAGFTLVELVVVVAIVSVLAALSFRVIVGIVSLARESATKTTVTKINRLLTSRLEAWNRKYGGTDRATVARLHNTAEYHTAGQFLTDNGFPVNENQRLILTRKLLYAAHAPQLKSDLTGPPWNLPAAEVASMDNAEVLYYLLIRAPVINEPIFGADDMRYGHEVTAFSDREIADTDSDGNPEFIDAWGHAIHLW